MQPCERLTAKEMQVAGLVWEGQTNREIARAIGTTEQVVKNYLRNTFDKLGVWSRLELVTYVARHGGERWQEEVVVRRLVGDDCFLNGTPTLFREVREKRVGHPVTRHSPKGLGRGKGCKSLHFAGRLSFSISCK